jgi:hypothetical protein
MMHQQVSDNKSRASETELSPDGSWKEASHKYKERGFKESTVDAREVKCES